MIQVIFAKLCRNLALLLAEYCFDLVKGVFFSILLMYNCAFFGLSPVGSGLLTLGVWFVDERKKWL